ncbi:hypothetical protein L484_013046 [Morus notabilis]|uniref:Rubisco accumulation factor 1 C-terminal domain-containing protein n=1 Tax=Morus notabilis TaxID=981085 RepID=W9SI21_9ROSA|nr:hypothetical protein L484_013046 [Morus notabilis]
MASFTTLYIVASSPTFSEFLFIYGHKNPSELPIIPPSDNLEPLSAAVTESAKGTVLEELNTGAEREITGEGEMGEEVRVPVVRLKIEEVAEASTVVVLPICKADEREKGLQEASRECRTEGEFGVVVAEKGWASPVPLLFLHDLPRRFNVGMLNCWSSGQMPVTAQTWLPWLKNSGLKRQHSVC